MNKTTIGMTLASSAVAITQAEFSFDDFSAAGCSFFGVIQGVSQPECK